MHSRLCRGALAVGVALLAGFVTPVRVGAAPSTDSAELRDDVTLDGVRAHQAAFQAIADANDGTRVSGSPGYDASADYVAGKLTAAGYAVTRAAFEFAFFEELTPAELEQTSPNAVVYEYLVDFFTMDYSGSADVTAAVTAVDLQLGVGNTSTSGCEAADFTGFPAGNIALIQRGSCNFSVKAINAENAGAVGAIIFNQGNTTDPDRTALFGGTLGGIVVGDDFPILSAPYALGVELNGLIASGLTMRIKTDTFSEIRATENVIAETAGGRADRVVVVGAHLDSVGAGPGINDNGSGSATILEIAEEIAEAGITPRNKIRFMWYGAEEAGLVGSELYVAGLSTRQIKDISVMLNFDMVGSPNFVRFVYDGDGSGTGTVGPNGSDVVEDVFLDYFASQNLPTEPTAFDGRSDYGPFIAVGIPSGGLFSGAEGIKTVAQAATYGGTAGTAYDPCYHQACDTFANNNNTVLDQFADAAAHATLTFAMTTSAVNGTDKGNAGGRFDQEFDGSHLKK